jgi:hypothetical protein
MANATHSKPELPAHLHADACPGTPDRTEAEVVERPSRDGLMRRTDDSLVGADIFEKVRVPGEKLRRVRCVDCGAAAYYQLHGEEPIHVEGR